MPHDGAHGPTRVLLVTGAGGSGKSTVACAVAARAARSDGPVLVVTVGRVNDPLFDSESLPFDHVNLNPVELLARWWDSLASSVRAGRAAVRGSDDDPGFDPFVLEPPELTGLADAEHLLILRAIRAHAASGEYAVVVVDGPVLDGLVALLTAPSSVAAYLERVWPRHLRLAGGASSALLLAEPLAGLAEELAAFVDDRDALRLVYAVTPDPGRPARARRELAALDVLGLRPIALVLTRVAPVDDRFALDLPHPAVRAMSGRIAAQGRARADIEALAAEIGRPVVEFAEGASEFDASAILVAQAPAAPVARLENLGGDGLETRYDWVLALPLVDPGTIGLGRVEEDVVIEADGVRRRLRLPSVLRRCTVAGAEYADGALHLRFAPDPEVWPRAR